jgi:hypothetical protein
MTTTIAKIYRSDVTALADAAMASSVPPGTVPDAIVMDPKAYRIGTHYMTHSDMEAFLISMFAKVGVAVLPDPPVSEKEYYFVSFLFKCYGADEYEPMTDVTDMHPLDFLQCNMDATEQADRERPDHMKRNEQYLLQFWSEITQEQYEKWEGSL